jgi:predicted ATPase/DNA-binding SARP family transcriptional activator
MQPPSLEVNLFGTLRVLVHGEPIPRVRTRSVEWLLALLVFRKGQAVSRSWLAGTLWPESEESQALDNLRHDLVLLRKALGPESGRIESPTRDTLAFDLTDARCDMAIFDAGIAVGEERSMRTAVDVYVGPVLEGSYVEWIVLERETRAEQYLAALTSLAEIACSRLDYPEAVQLLRRGQALDPLRDSTARPLMAALAAMGDPGASVEVYRKLRQRLHDELNASPDEATTRLFREIRRAAREAPVIRTSEPEERQTAIERFRRPAYPLSPLIGREREVVAVQELLGQKRLVTLVGAGGVGKTRLALEVAGLVEEESQGGVAWVELASLNEEALLLPALAASLGVPVESEGDGDVIIGRILSRIEELPVLLVLDNCEHLMDAVAAAIQMLLGACASLKILATSRQRLGLIGEAAWRVPSLSSPGAEQFASALEFPAVQLFIQRAEAARPGFLITDSDDVAAVCTICRRLDGIPLALELAAARIGTLTPRQIAERLNDRFALLTTGARGAVPRQKTLRSLIAWSYELLADEERAFLRRLSVFGGDCTLEAVEAVCDGEALDALHGLAEKSLALAEENKGNMRYRMLESVREFAAGELATMGEEAVARDRHLAHFLRFAQECVVFSPEEASAKLIVESGNLHQALAWARSKSSNQSLYVKFVAALWPLWLHHGSLFDGCVHVQAAIEHCSPDTSVDREQLRLGAFLLTDVFHNAWLRLAARSMKNLGEADEFSNAQALERTLSAQRSLGHLADMVVTLRCLKQVALDNGNLTLALSYLGEAVQIARDLNNRFYLGITVHELGCTLYQHGDLFGARDALTEAVALFRQPGGEYGMGFCCNNLGQALNALGDVVGAALMYREALPLFLRTGNWDGIAWALALMSSSFTVEEAELAAELLASASCFQPVMSEAYASQTLAAARNSLGETGFEGALQAGRQLSGQEVLSKALKQMSISEDILVASRRSGLIRN